VVEAPSSDAGSKKGGLESPFIESVLREDLLAKNRDSERFEQVRAKRQKQEAYGKFVREMNPVQVSPRKNGELLTNISRIKHPVRQQKDKYDNFLVELKQGH
jgi:hypothetical protein